MTEKEKQIEEMAKAIIENYKKSECSSCKTCVDEKCSFLCYQYCKIYDECSILYKAGYRKQSEVVKEFAGRLKERFEKTSTMATALHGRKESEITSIIDTVAAEYGVEVEK